MRTSAPLVVDAAINLLLGLALLFFPAFVVAFLGVPRSEKAFYPSILRAVLAGIGVALLVERFRVVAGWLGELWREVVICP